MVVFCSSCSKKIDLDTAKLENNIPQLCKDCYQRQVSDIYLGKKIPLAGTAHQCGTARFGKDPKTSVLDINCKAHELDNLYIVDSSFFPSSSAVNPALTVMAQALKTGDHLINNVI